MNSIKPKKQKSLLKSIAVVFLSLALLIILFFSVLVTLFLIYKNDISKTILLGVNNKIEGEISFSDISFTPFRHFPNASLILNDLTLKEGEDSISYLNKQTVFSIKEAYVSVKLLDLLSSKISVSKISFEGGNVNIFVYPDSQTNLQKAVKRKTDKKIVDKKKQTSAADTVKQKKETEIKAPSEFSLNIDDLSIDDVEVNLENKLKKNKVLLKINELQSEFYYNKKQIVCSLNLDTNIDSLIKNENLLLSDQQINFESKLDIETDSIFVKLEDGRFAIGGAEFLFNGLFDSQNQGYLNLSFKGLDEDFSLFALFLSEEGMKNLKSGDFVIEGTVVGKTLSEFPAIDISFGLQDVNLINPITQREIRNLNLRGQINSGNADDWSDARLVVDTLSADLPDGKVKLSGSISNLTYPEVDVNIFLSGDVTGLDKVFKSGSITDLKGKVKLTDRIEGKYDIYSKKFVSSVNRGSIFFNDFGIKIPGTIRFDKVNGTIRRDNDELYLDSLSIISEDTDILINGKVSNVNYLFFDVEKDIVANLDIKSSVFDLPNFLAFDPSIKRDFNYRILDLDVSVIAKTTTSKATKFKSFPAIDFDIKKLYAIVENFLPRLEINSGKFKISESLLGFNLKCDNFKTKFLDGNFNFNAEYNTSKFQPFYIKIKTDFKDIFPSVLFYDKTDTIPESINGKLSGSFSADLQFPLDSTFLKFINIKDANLVYELTSDTIRTKSLNVSLNDIYFNNLINPNPFATLSTKGKISLQEFESNFIVLTNAGDSGLELSIENGEYKITSKRASFFGENAQGKSFWKIKPFAETPTYYMKFDVSKFYAEEMFSTFLEDTLVTGPLSLFMEVNFNGSEWDKMFENIQGSINLSGKNLTFYGLDADKLIKNFQESQNFNLVDLGGVILAGPVGLVVTKGSDYASLFFNGSGEITHINSLVSNWNLGNGEFTIKDAAFSTNKNRIASIGSINFFQDSLDLTVALLNPFGCSVFSQRIYGNLSSPTLGKVKVVGTVLAPVTNIVDDVTGKDCDVFYSGSVEHPVNKSKKDK